MLLVLGNCICANPFDGYILIFLLHGRFLLLVFLFGSDQRLLTDGGYPFPILSQPLPVFSSFLSYLLLSRLSPWNLHERSDNNKVFSKLSLAVCQYLLLSVWAINTSSLHITSALHAYIHQTYIKYVDAISQPIVK